AFDALHGAEDVFARLGLRQRVSEVKAWLSRTFKQTGQFGKAEESIRHAIEIDREIHNEAVLATDYDDLSQIYRERGQLDEAEKWLREAIKIDERRGDEPELAIVYHNLSIIYSARG